MTTMTTSGDTTHRTCPGCGSARVLHYPPSRQSARSVLRCRSCGLRSWAEHHELLEPLHNTLQSAEDDRDFAAEYTGYADAKRQGTVDSAWADTLARLRQMVGPAAAPRLYDVGAGDGAFLRLAESRGFRVAGNEVHSGAIRLAAQRYGYQLDAGDLADLDLEPIHDALTMWCVMVHTDDVDQTLRNCHAMLKPGGTLFLQTPHWTTADQVALSTLRATGGRVARVVDRRVASHHWQLHTTRSIRVLLARNGFDTVSVRPRARYSLNSTLYLQSLGLSESMSRRTSKVVDLLIKYGPVPRIVLDVYARKR